MSAWIAALLLVAPLSPPSDPIVPKVTVEADGTSTLTMQTMIAAPIGAVWTAVSTPEGWQRWAAPVARLVPGEENMLETSYKADAKLGDPSTIRQRFVAWIPGRMLAFRTVKAPAGFPNFETHSKVITVIELHPAGDNATHMVLTAVNYPDNEAGRQLLGFFREGNRQTLEKLRDTLARP